MSGRRARSLAGRIRARLPLYRKPAVLALSGVGLVTYVWLLFIVPTYPTFRSKVGFDAFAYWSVDPFHPYTVALGGLSSFTYSPAFAMAVSPLHNLSFDAFFFAWEAFLLLNMAWLTRRMALVWLVFLPVPLELFHGNVHILLATVCVLGFDYPALWAFGLLTKVTPGVGLLWFAVRREWRPLAIALGATAAIAAVSFAIAPGTWFDWARFLATSQANGADSDYLYESLLPPLWLRGAAAAAIVVWGARTDRRWAVPVAVVVAAPVVWITTPAILMAVPRLRARRIQAGRTSAPRPGLDEQG